MEITLLKSKTKKQEKEFYIEYAISSVAHIYDKDDNHYDEGKCFSRINGIIKDVDSEHENSGEISASIIHTDYIANHGYNVFVLFDCESAQLAEFSEYLDDNCFIKNKFFHKKHSYDYNCHEEIVFIDEIILEKSLIGQGYGKQIFLNFRNLFKKNKNMFILKPWPLQIGEDKLREYGFSQSLDKSTKKLIKTYEGYGFTKSPTSEFMYML